MTPVDERHSIVTGRVIPQKPLAGPYDQGTLFESEASTPVCHYPLLRLRAGGTVVAIHWVNNHFLRLASHFVLLVSGIEI